MVINGWLLRMKIRKKRVLDIFLIEFGIGLLTGHGILILLIILVVVGYILVKNFLVILKDCLKKRRNNQFTSIRAALGINRDLDETTFMNPVAEPLPAVPVSSLQGTNQIVQPIIPLIEHNPLPGLPVTKIIDESSSASSSTGPGKGIEVKKSTHESVQMKNFSASIDNISEIRK
jgi:hypothetical protein